MPNGRQADLEDAKRVVRHLGIRGTIVNIGEVTCAIERAMDKGEPVDGASLQPEITADAHINTCNLSEKYIGYSTKDGDGTGDVAPLEQYTASEMVQIGLSDFLHLPHDLVQKTPSDGLCGKTDEENIGFSYAVLDRFIRTGICDDLDVRIMKTQ